jgi:cytoskeleton protein RodZ
MTKAHSYDCGYFHGISTSYMSQEPQKPRWPESEVKTIPKRMPNEMGSGEAARESEAKRGSFGERLQRERELRAISLDEIAKSTKIGTRLLQALEAEEFDKLPGGIFNKGFVRAYAKYLGLDEEQAVTDFMAAESEKERERRSPIASEENRNASNPKLFAIQGGSRADNVYNMRASAEVVEQDPPQANGFLMAAVILVFVLGIGGFGWKYYNAHSDAKAETSTDQTRQTAPALRTPQPAPVQTQPSPTAATDTAMATSTTPAQVSDATINAAKPATNPSAAAKKPDDIITKSSDASLTAKSITPADTTTKAATIPGAFTLDLRADEQSWVQISSEGKVLWTGMVNKDATKTFRASKELIVKLGNAPGVELSYNGKPLPRFSQDAKTRTLTFTTQGLTPQ